MDTQISEPPARECTLTYPGDVRSSLTGTAVLGGRAAVLAVTYDPTTDTTQVRATRLVHPLHLLGGEPR